MKSNKLFFLILWLLVWLPGMLLSHSASAQNQREKVHNDNGWYMYFGDHRLNDKWGLHTEVQFRRHNIISDPQQLLIRTGINYALTSSAMVTLGYGFIETYPYGGDPVGAIFPEQRIYQQLQFRNNLARLVFTHRYRQEQRWLKRPGDEDYTYFNRTRYFLKAVLPLSGPTVDAKEFFLAAYDEIFVNYGENVQVNIFDQNRAYAALGYKLNDAASLELGYLNQIIQKPNGRMFEHNHTLQVSLFYNLNFARQ
ncbi:DUF2490 domain-containing protein [Pontibacter sp. 13R65]|uniref:DUF2490 domain-containing protein n=1 Tax=Pontibacter sp. 13R65 TaxID=3127458 RepID=UPI00301BC5C4